MRYRRRVIAKCGGAVALWMSMSKQPGQWADTQNRKSKTGFAKPGARRNKTKPKPTRGACPRSETKPKRSFVWFRSRFAKHLLSRCLHSRCLHQTFLEWLLPLLDHLKGERIYLLYCNIGRRKNLLLQLAVAKAPQGKVRSKQAETR